MTEGIKTDRLGLTDLPEISDLLLRHHAVNFRVAGWSMYPTLWKGDRLTAEPVSPMQLQIGDLLFFRVRFAQGARLVCHRLVAREETCGKLQFVTKGDAVTGCGETIQPEQVLGKVVAVRKRWSWARASHRVAALAMRLDLGREQLIQLIVQGLQYLQGLGGYRRIMRSVLSRSFAFYLGVPEGSRWIRYHPMSRDGNASLPTERRDFHLVAELGGTYVGSLTGKAGAEGYRIETLYVRIRYRGMGVASQLLALAATAAAVSGVRVLLASVEPPNRAALHLFSKAGFHKIGGRRGNQVCLRREL